MKNLFVKFVLFLCFLIIPFCLVGCGLSEGTIKVPSAIKIEVSAPQGVSDRCVNSVFNAIVTLIEVTGGECSLEEIKNTTTSIATCYGCLEQVTCDFSDKELKVVLGKGNDKLKQEEIII